jgi:transposase
LEKIVEKYDGKKIVMILDNARIHHAKLIQPFLRENEATLKLMYLPPYSPKLNPIEGLWGWMKSEIINNVFFSSVQEIKTAVNN